MAFNSVTYRQDLINVPNNVTHPSFSQLSGWAKEDSGHRLVNRKTNEEMVGIIVGKISEYRLLCGPVGNFHLDSKFAKDYSAAKFQLDLGIPDEPALVPIFKSSVATLLKVEKNISTTKDNRYLLTDSGDMTTIRFSSKLFEKRPLDVVDVDTDVFLSDLENPDPKKPAPVNPDAPREVDEETENWPIPNTFQPALCNIKRSYCVQPLRVYVEGKFIEPGDVNHTLANALAEIHFTLKHYHIQRPGENAFDSFTANIEQINVLKTGVPRARTAYKRSNPRSGPVPTKRIRLVSPTKEQSPVASGSGQQEDNLVDDQNENVAAFVATGHAVTGSLPNTHPTTQQENAKVSDGTAASSTNGESFADTHTHKPDLAPPTDDAVTVVTQSIVPSTPVGANSVTTAPKHRGTRNKAKKIDGN